jgi:ERCC4-related helicase
MDTLPIDCVQRRPKSGRPKSKLFGKIHCLLTTLETAENKYQCSADSVSRAQCKHKNGVLDNID